MGSNNSKRQIGTIVSRIKKVGSDYETIKSYDTGLLIFNDYKSFCIWLSKKFKLPSRFGTYGVEVIADGVKLPSWLMEYGSPCLIELKYDNASILFSLMK